MNEGILAQNDPVEPSAKRVSTRPGTVPAHTPGPWVAYDRGIGWEVQHNHPSGEERPVNDEFRDTFTEADAHLIAAAPELLDACKFAFAAMNSESGRERAKNVLVAAIAKATTSSGDQ